jgi:DNA polymerase III epsilon subunit-like protein
MSHNKYNYVFYDLETNGLDYYTTGIMQITLLDITGNVIINQYVYPYDHRIDGTSIHGIDEKKLIHNKAIETHDLCDLLNTTLNKEYGTDNPIYLIGYNNFGYDQIILENNFKICNIPISKNWYFIDIYPIIKELYPTMKPNFKLATVYENLCSNPDIKTEDIQFHCALADTKCLYEIYKIIENKTDFLEKYTRPLLQNPLILNSSICNIQGYIAKLGLERKNIKTIGDLYTIFKNFNYREDDFEVFLKYKLNIYSIYVSENLKKQMKILFYFLNN